MASKAAAVVATGSQQLLLHVSLAGEWAGSRHWSRRKPGLSPFFFGWAQCQGGKPKGIKNSPVKISIDLFDVGKTWLEGGNSLAANPWP